MGVRLWPRREKGNKMDKVEKEQTGDTRIVETVAENVRRARKAAGLSQEELAIEAQLDRTYISQVERGKRNITVVVLARLARAMHTTAAALVTEPARTAAEKVRVSRFGHLAAQGSYWLVFWAFSLRYEAKWGSWEELTRWL
jgi:transcriptional regulator with XRE-family HTH domain